MNARAKNLISRIFRERFLAALGGGIIILHSKLSFVSQYFVHNPLFFTQNIYQLALFIPPPISSFLAPPDLIFVKKIRDRSFWGKKIAKHFCNKSA